MRIIDNVELTRGEQMKTKRIPKLGMLVLLLVVMIPIVALTKNNVNYMDFIKNYVWPTDAKVNKNFTYPLPEGFEKAGDMIIQAESEDSFSTNILTKYVNDDGITVVETYKNSQNKDTGKFIRLVGTIGAVKYGYPKLTLDAPIINVILFEPPPLFGELTDVNTFMAHMLPQASPEQSEMFFDCLEEKAADDGVELHVMPTGMPAWWGPAYAANWDGINLDMMQRLRDNALECYELIISETAAEIPFDYRPMQDLLIYAQAEGEHQMFANLGISVPTEAQAAFFAAISYVPPE